MYKNLAGGGQGGGGGGTGSSGTNSGSTGVRMSWPTKGNVLGLDKGYKQVACYGQGCNGIEWIKEGHTPDTKRAWEFHYQKPKDDLRHRLSLFSGATYSSSCRTYYMGFNYLEFKCNRYPH